MVCSSEQVMHMFNMMQNNLKETPLEKEEGVQNWGQQRAETNVQGSSR
jgi:hypothetical protein